MIFFSEIYFQFIGEIVLIDNGFADILYISRNVRWLYGTAVKPPRLREDAEWFVNAAHYGVPSSLALRERLPGAFARADEDLDIACNLPWRARGTNYFRVNLIPLQFYLSWRGREAGGGSRELDTGEVWNIRFEGEDICYIFLFSRAIPRSDFCGSSLCALHSACMTSPFVMDKSWQRRRDPK